MFYTSAPNTPKSPDLDWDCIEREQKEKEMTSEESKEVKVV